jgi:Icc-related predicted phosphoesterase
VGNEPLVPLKPPGAPEPSSDGRTVRIAAAGDIHITDANCGSVAEAFREVDESADLILLAGDLTTHGEPAQAELMADAVAGVETPVIAVLGNHDWHVNRVPELTAILEDAGVKVLDKAWSIERIGDCEVGIVGAKGFVGGFPGSHLPDFGEPSLRGVYAEATEEVDAVDDGLRAVAACPFRVVLLHYAPSTDTLVGEPEPIWAFLGTDRLASPIVEHAPDLVLHGHAHAGTFAGRVGEVPVFNVSVPVMGRDFWVFELSTADKLSSSIH